MKTVTPRAEDDRKHWGRLAVSITPALGLCCALPASTARKAAFGFATEAVSSTAARNQLKSLTDLLREGTYLQVAPAGACRYDLIDAGSSHESRVNSRSLGPNERIEVSGGAEIECPPFLLCLPCAGQLYDEMKRPILPLRAVQSWGSP